MIIHFNRECRAQGWTKTREGIKMEFMQVENDLKHQLSIGALWRTPDYLKIWRSSGYSITPVREALLRLVSVNALSVAPAQIYSSEIKSATNWN